MDSFNNGYYDRHSTAYVRRRLAEATLSQDQHDGSSWRQLDPGPPAVASKSRGARSLHDGLLGNALQHVDEYMSKDTHVLAIGESLEAQIDPEGHWFPQDMASSSQDDAGYMERPSAFQWGQETAEKMVEMHEDKPLPSMSFALRPKQNATIIYYGDDNALKTLQGVDLVALSKICPLLAMAFEESRSGPQLFLETLSSRTAEPFLRFLNTRSYAVPSEEWNSGGRFEDVPTSLLLHCEMFRLGDIYDLPEMKSQAYVNVLRQCEFGCSSPDKPIDLCAAIRFVYTYLEKEDQLIDAMVNYCVACFLCHRLAKDAGFKQLAYDLRPFHQDLCKNCMDRGFENETAAAIIQMPFEPHRPETYASTEQHSKVHDVVFHFHANDEMDSPKKRKRPDTGKLSGMESMRQRVQDHYATAQIKVEQDTDDDVFIPTENKRQALLGVNPGGRLVVMNPDAQKPEPESDDDVFIPTEDKRLPPSGVNPGGRLVLTNPDEEEFEEIDLGPAREKAAESDSDSFEWVDVLPEHFKDAGRASTSLPLRTREQAASSKQAEGNESDSDWSLL